MSKRLALLIILAVVASPAAAQAVGDPVAGAKLFGQCRMCHAVDAAKPDGLGPNLWGIYNGKAARRARFNYSPVLKKSAIVWDDANLDRWLANPSTMVKGNRMLFAGIPRQPVRADIVAYLKTLK